MFGLSTFWLIIIGIILFAICFTFIANIISDYIMRKDIAKKEILLANCGIKHSGSTLTHGMCINSKGDLVGVEFKNVNWYKRLIK